MVHSPLSHRNLPSHVNTEIRWLSWPATIIAVNCNTRRLAEFSFVTVFFPKLPQNTVDAMVNHIGTTNAVKCQIPGGWTVHIFHLGYQNLNTEIHIVCHIKFVVEWVDYDSHRGKLNSKGSFLAHYYDELPTDLNFWMWWLPPSTTRLYTRIVKLSTSRTWWAKWLNFLSHSIEYRNTMSISLGYSDFTSLITPVSELIPPITFIRVPIVCFTVSGNRLFLMWSPSKSLTNTNADLSCCCDSSLRPVH